jgi:hypothetical protein
MESVMNLKHSFVAVTSALLVMGSGAAYEAASGGGTYTLESLTDTLAGGRFKGQLVLP